MSVDDPDLSVERREDGVDPPSEPDSRDMSARVTDSTGLPQPLRMWRPWKTVVAAGFVYVAIGFVLWIHAWVDGVTTHTLCGCGDPALFLWFFQWPATALAHGENPFYSTALFHPQGFNLLSQTSVMGLSVPLIPVTWIWGPVASLNVASTLTPALTAFSAFVVLRRWTPWTPAAFVGGLFYGFSPFVLSSLPFGHLQLAALMLFPPILAVLDEILIRQRHSAVWSGALLGVLVFAQFFFSSELLVIVAVACFISIVALVVAGVLWTPRELRRRAGHAAKGVGVGLAIGAVLLAWPAWYALDGPAHLSGLVWVGIPLLGGFVSTNFVSVGPPARSEAVAFGGYGGHPLGSATYLGWTLLAVLVVGLVVFRRDRRLCFFGFLLALSAELSLGPRPGIWVPEQVFEHLPVLENVIEQRYIAVGFLAAATMLAIILTRVHDIAPDWRGALGALGVGLVALLPLATLYGPWLPYTMQSVILPRWYMTVAPNLPPGRVLLSYPGPFSGIQSAMSWQAVNRMHYSQAGGGGPQGQAFRAGSAAAGDTVLKNLGFGSGLPLPSETPAALAAVRHALVVWKVNTVVVATSLRAPAQQQGNDPTYAAAFMTASLGRLPTLQAGAWVWDEVRVSAHAPFDESPGTMKLCVLGAEGPSRHVVVSMRAVDCVEQHDSALRR
jgi:hypothetical protein